MKNWLRSILGRRQSIRSRNTTASGRGLQRLRLQSLEDRTVPATVITILDGGVGTLDGFLSPTDGTITAADSAGVPGSVSRAALQAVNANVNISITAEDSIVFNDLTSPLALTTGAGNSATFAANTTSISFTDVADGLSTAGGDATFTATTTMTLGGVAANGGNVLLSAARNMTLNAPVSTAGSGSITVKANTANIGGNGLTTTATGTLATNAGKIDVSSNALMTIGGAVSSTGGGNIFIKDLVSIAVTTLNINAAVTASGGNGSIQLSSPDHISLTAPVSTVGNGSIDVTADTDKIAGGTFSNTAAGTLTAAGNLIDISASDVSLAGTITNSGQVTLEPVIGAATIHLGSNTSFGVSDAELGLITADVVRIGTLTNNGGIVIDGAITRHAGFDTLTIITDGGISQSASLSVAELAAQASGGNVILTDGGNDVDFIAGTADSLFDYVDANGFEVTGVDIRAGIFLGGAGTGDTVILQAGGKVTQSANEIINTDNLLFLGAGSFEVTDPGNDAATFAAFVTGSVSYTDSNSLKVGTVFFAGVTTSNAAVSITTSAQVSDTTLTVNDIISSGGGAVTLSADNLVLNNTVNAGGAVATLQPTTTGREIDLGTNPSAGKLGVSQTDLNKVTGGSIVIGSTTAGDLSVTQQITPATTNRLDLVTGGQIIDAHGGTDLVVSQLVLIAETGIGISAPNFELDTTVGQLEAHTNTGGITVTDSDSLQIGGITDALSGVEVVTSGNINITASTGTLSLADLSGLQIVTGGATSGDVFLNAFGATSDVIDTVDFDAIAAPAGSVTVFAGQDILLGTVGTDHDNDVRSNKDLTFTAGRDITIDGFSDIAADDFGQNTGGNVSFTAGRDINITDAKGSDASVGNNGTTGSVTLSAANDVTLHAQVFTNGTGQVSITFDSDNDFIGAFTSAAAGSISTDGGSIGVQGGTDSAHGLLATIGAPVAINGGTGSILANCAGSINVNAAISVSGTGGIFITADSNNNATGAFANTAAGTLTTDGGVISITASDVTIGGAIDTTTASFADVFLQPSTNAATIHLGTNVGFGVTDAELDLITASAVILGTGSNTGGIQLTGQVSLDPTKVKTLELLTTGTGGAITDNTAGEQADITVQDLLLIANSGIGVGVGSPGDIDIDATNLAGDNTSATAGVINIFSYSPTLNVSAAGTGFFTLLQLKNSNASAATGQVSIHGNGDLNIKSSVQASGNNNVVLQSGDNLTIEAKASVTAGGTIGVSIDVPNTDAGVGATATIAGKVTALLMNVNGNTDSDTFNITPSATTPISVDGNNPTPPTLPGDSLNIDTVGTTGIALTRNNSASGFFGDYQFTNRAKVSYQHIESLSPEGVDLSILMADSPDPVVPGGKITYTITVNIGDTDGLNVLLTDTLPANTTFVSFTAPAGWVTVTPSVGGTGDVTASLATLAGNSASQVFTLVVHVNGNTPNNTLINNTAKVDSSSIETNPGDNLASATTTVKHVVLPIVVGADAGGGSHVKVYDPVTGAEIRSFFAYPNFKGGVRVAAGDVNGDGVADIVTGAGPGGGPHVKAFDGVTGAEIRSFFAYTAKFSGGVFVAVGDVNEDGFADIITGADAGGGPHVEVFSGQDGKLLASYYAYASTFTGGVRVAAGDINGDGKADVITGAGPTGGPRITVRNASDLSLLRDFFAYDASVTTGVYVASGDLNNDGKDDIITGAGKGSVSHTIVYSGADNKILQSFVAYNSNFTGGVRVAVADVGADGQLDLVTGAGPGGGPHVRAFQGDTQTEVKSFFAYDPTFMGGVFVG